MKQWILLAVIIGTINVSFVQGMEERPGSPIHQCMSGGLQINGYTLTLPRRIFQFHMSPDADRAAVCRFLCDLQAKSSQEVYEAIRITLIPGTYTSHKALRSLIQQVINQAPRPTTLTKSQARALRKYGLLPESVIAKALRS